jgi:hypothetical protein
MCTLAKMHLDAFKKYQILRGVGGHRDAQTINQLNLNLFCILRFL